MNTQNKHPELNQPTHPVLGIPQHEARQMAWDQPGIAPSAERARSMGAVTLASNTTEYGDMHAGKPTINAVQAKNL